MRASIREMAQPVTKKVNYIPTFRVWFRAGKNCQRVSLSDSFCAGEQHQRVCLIFYAGLANARNPDIPVASWK